MKITDKPGKKNQMLGDSAFQKTIKKGVSPRDLMLVLKWYTIWVRKRSATNKTERITVG